MSLWDKIDETSPNDSDYIWTGTRGDESEVKLSTISTPLPASGNTVRVRAAGNPAPMVVTAPKTQQPLRPVEINARLFGGVPELVVSAPHGLRNIGSGAKGWTTSGAPTFGGGQRGDYEIKLNGSTDGIQTAVPELASSYTPAVTILLRFTPKHALDSSAIESLFGAGYFAVSWNHTNATFHASVAMYDNSVGWQSIQLADKTVGVTHTICGTYLPGTNDFVLYQNGVYVGTYNMTGSLADGSGAYQWILSHPAYPFYGGVSLAVMHRANVPTSLAQDLSGAPYQSFVPERRITFPFTIFTTKLVQGTTVKATWTDPLTQAEQTFPHALTSGEASSITDGADLRLRMRFD